jgi:predicted HicB family RNase H-like nuclease
VSGRKTKSKKPSKAWFYETTNKPRHAQDFTSIDERRVRDSRGRRIDAGYLKRTKPASSVGRPSLNGKAEESPRINVRVAPQLLKQAEKIAKRRHMSVSELTRVALEKEVARLRR